MLKVFNAFQIMCLFLGLPFGIGWLYTNPFPFSFAAFVVAVIAYGVMFAGGVAMITHQLEKE